MIYDSEQLHQDIEGRLLSLDTLHYVQVLRDQPGVVDNDILQAIGGLNFRNGKSGAMIVVMAPEEVCDDKDSVGPAIKVRVSCRIFTNALTNNGETGTGLSNAEIRRHVRMGLHHWSPNGSNQIYVDKKGGQPFDSGEEGVESYELDVAIELPETFSAPLPAPKILTPESGKFFITSFRNGIDTGAMIWYTVDGSMPYPNGPGSILFGSVLLTEDDVQILAEDGTPLLATIPLPIPEGTEQIRAAAYLPNRPGSDVATLNITT